MAKLKTPEAPRAGGAPPQYAAPPPEVLSAAPAAPSASVLDIPGLSAIQETCRNASYSLLDVRNGEWCLLVFGGGANLRRFGSFQEGIDFVRKAGIENCRCLQVPDGVIR